jgi:acyl-CoA thioesterase
MFDYTRYLKKLESGESSQNPFLDFMGMGLEEIRDGYARFRMPVRKEFTQCNGVVQGGLLVALADESIAHAIMTILEPHENIATIEVKNNFLSSAESGSLTAEAKVFKKGRSLVIGDCLVTNDEGRAISRTSATFLICTD